MGCRRDPRAGERRLGVAVRRAAVERHHARHTEVPNVLEVLLEVRQSTLERPEVLRAEEGSLYPALHRMEEAGWIKAEWVTKDSGRRARMYELTAAGKKQLAAEETRWHAVTSAVNRVLRMA